MNGNGSQAENEGEEKTLRLTTPVGVVDLKLHKNLGVDPQNHTRKLLVRILEILQPDWDVAAIPKALAWRGKICSSHSNLLLMCQMGVA
jgi:hypothetical protein